jgi:hypothetical protein
MKKIVVSLMTAFALMGSAPVFAQAPAPALDPAAVAAAREMFDAMNYRETMKGVMQQMVQGMGKAMHDGAAAGINNDPKTTPEQKKAALAKMEAELPAAMNQVRTVMSDPGLVDEIVSATVPVYARTFNADELKQIAAFYRSPVGAKVLATMPQLMGEGMQVGQQIMMRRLQPLLQKMQQEHAAGK